MAHPAMIWDRFHFTCRLRCAAPTRDFAETVQYFRSNEDVDLVGPPPPPSALPDLIMERLGMLAEKDRERAVALYASMDLGGAAPLPRKVLRSIAYLVALSVVYLGMTSTYSILVMPTIANTLASYGVTSLPHAAIMNLSWAPLLTMMAVVAMLSGLALYVLQRCCKLGVADSGSKLMLFLPPSIRRRYTNIVELATYPVTPAAADSALTGRLRVLESEGIDIAEELPRMIRHQWAAFAHSAQRYLNVLLGVAAVIIVLTVSFFVSSAYSPLFIGEYIL